VLKQMIDKLFEKKEAFYPQEVYALNEMLESGLPSEQAMEERINNAMQRIEALEKAHVLTPVKSDDLPKPEGDGEIKRANTADYCAGWWAGIEAYKNKMKSDDLPEVDICSVRRGKPLPEWKCPHCGKDEGTWFDRTLDENGDMTTRCNACGKNIDALPTPQTGLIIHCDVCGMLITQPGALLFSPPNDGMVKKYHLCKQCYEARYEDKTVAPEFISIRRDVAKMWVAYCDANPEIKDEGQDKDMYDECTRALNEGTTKK
jgi:DNA-directed RNA polymerase subunit M/transcription elongation factor TFIIS